jgi:hypothetical protein
VGFVGRWGDDQRVIGFNFFAPDGTGVWTNKTPPYQAAFCMSQSARSSGVTLGDAIFEIVINLLLGPSVGASADLNWPRESLVPDQLVDVLTSEGNSLLSEVTKAKHVHVSTLKFGDEVVTSWR